MSRIGKKAIDLPANVTVTVDGANHVVVKGPNGTLEANFSPLVTINVEDNKVNLTIENENNKQANMMHGTSRANLHNMVEGVSKGFEKRLEIKGVGYRAQAKGDTLVVTAGYSHNIEMKLPEGIKVECPTPTEVVIKGVNKQVVGEFAANVRNIRRPEPYLGKGIRYKGENVRRKEGKAAKK